MTYDQVMDYFGTGYRVAVELGLSQGYPPDWKKKGYVPLKIQFKIEEYTKGYLKAGLEEIPRE